MGAETQFVESENVVDALDERVAVVALTHVDYRTGRAHDMQAVTEHAHRKGALVVWDLAHTAGALRCELGECQVDFAVGCGYKYLNGGPGAPGFIFVARRHLSEVRQPLTGWHGHIRPFEFEAQYTPSEGIARMLTGTAPQIGLFSLEEALKVFDDIRMEQVHAKSERMTELFMRLVWQELKGFGFRIVTPLESGRRGSQVSMTHAQGYPIVQAMIARGVIGDFRAPSTLRFGLAALYLKFVEIWEAVVALREIMERRAWDTPELRQRQLVT
jgi:kynureninase